MGELPFQYFEPPCRQKLLAGTGTVNHNWIPKVR
jgi:hypothetical protein